MSDMGANRRATDARAEAGAHLEGLVVVGPVWVVSVRSVVGGVLIDHSL